MPPDDEMHPPNWQRYYSRTAAIPESAKVAAFLSAIPQAGRVLDFGAGSGRWAAAFMRDRPDITVDVLDQHIEQATLLLPNWRGEKMAVRFEDFTPTHRYDGIWSFASLFFLEPAAFEHCFGTLVSALAARGVLFFSMVEDCEAARGMKLYGMQQADIEALLERYHLTLKTLKRSETSRYGANETPIATYFVTASRL